MAPGSAPASFQSVIDEKMRVWREGMAALAAQPHVCVKLSMLPYTRRPL